MRLRRCLVVIEGGGLVNPAAVDLAAVHSGPGRRTEGGHDPLWWAKGRYA
jgi:hypothetical protein